MRDLLIYNPTCDMAVENATNSFMPSQLLSKFERDISPLMAFLGRESDFILYEKPLSDSFKAFWTDAGVALPTFIRKSEVDNYAFDNVRPWGWSQIIQSNYAKYIQSSHQLPIFQERGAYRPFFSRQTSVLLCHELNNYSLPPFVSIPFLPQSVSKHSAIVALLKQHSAGIVLKTLWSSSGRGLVFIRNQQQMQHADNWIKAQLKKHGSLIIEPIYQKTQDASLQFNISPSGQYEFYGINYFDADQQGHFSKEFFHTPKSINEHLPDNPDWINHTADAIIESMKAQGIHEKYFGPIGIDAMFIKGEDGETSFYPLVEANLRCNMGLVNMQIKQLIANGTSGTWQIDQFKEGEAPAFYENKSFKHPIRFIDGKIAKGFFPLTPFEADTRFAAWGIVY